MALTALPIIWAMARVIAIRKGCGGLGFADCIFTSTRDALVRRIMRYSGCRPDVVSRIISDLTFGSRGFDLPDPALQPIIPLSGAVLALPNILFFGNAAERNLLALMNRLPEERSIYSRLVGEKEALMRGRILDALRNRERAYRYRFGSISGPRILPDVDLAIIDDAERSCLLIELKWFIEPAEPREVIQRSEEIHKGIDQLLVLAAAIERGYEPILALLGIDRAYTIGLVVVSANSISAIGHALELPVLRENHLVQKLLRSDGLSSVIRWLEKREYLPIEGEDFSVEYKITVVGGWEIQWYAIRPLIDDEFMPT